MVDYFVKELRETEAESNRKTRIQGEIKRDRETKLQKQTVAETDGQTEIKRVTERRYMKQQVYPFWQY